MDAGLFLIGIARQEGFLSPVLFQKVICNIRRLFFDNIGTALDGNAATFLAAGSLGFRLRQELGFPRRTEGLPLSACSCDVEAMRYKPSDFSSLRLPFLSRIRLSSSLHLDWYRVAPKGALLGAGLLTAWVAADLFWSLTAPAPVALRAANPSNAIQAAQAIGQRQLMGVNDKTAGAAANPAAESARIVVLGLVSSVKGQPGFAVLAVNGQAPRGVVEGEELLPGVRLDHVAPDYIETSTGGVSQRVSLAPRQAFASAAQAGLQPPPVEAHSAAPPERAGDSHD